MDNHSCSTFHFSFTSCTGNPTTDWLFGAVTKILAVEYLSFSCSSRRNNNLFCSVLISFSGNLTWCFCKTQWEILDVSLKADVFMPAALWLCFGASHIIYRLAWLAELSVMTPLTFLPYYFYSGVVVEWLLIPGINLGDKSSFFFMKKCPEECKLVLLLMCFVTSKLKMFNWKSSGGEIQTTARPSCVLSWHTIRRAKSTLQHYGLDGFLMILGIFTSSLGSCI